MPGLLNTKEGAVWLAGVVQGELALSKLRAYKSDFVPNASSTRADFVANECDFSGYPAGGITLTAFLDPGFDPNGGASIQSPAVQFAVATATPIVPNVVGGVWIETAAGDFVNYGALDPDEGAMQVVGDILPVSLNLVYGKNPT